MRDVAEHGEIAPALREWVALEQQFKENLEAEGRELRIYPWHPTALPETPCIWNLIDTGDYELIDTARADDLIFLATTVAVRPSNFDQDMDQLVELIDIFRRTVDPAMAENPPLGGTVTEGRRVLTRPAFPEFPTPQGVVPLIGLTMVVKLKLAAFIR